MFIRKLKIAGTRNYCRNAFVVYQGSDISLVSEGTVICTLKKNGTVSMRRIEGELSATYKRHITTFFKMFEHRMS